MRVAQVFAGACLRPRRSVFAKTQRPRTVHFPRFASGWLFLAAFFAIFFISPRSLAQEDMQEQPAQEIVANLCAGRVVIGVAKDGIVIATLEDPIEPQTRPPMIVQISDERVVVLLGATDWWLPSERRELARIDLELPSLPAPEGGAVPRLGGDASAQSGSEANDIEQIAQRLHARLNWVAGHVHGNLKLPGGEPLVEMVLADYAPDYGPEVWLIQYSLEQEPEQGEYWQTRVLQPQYTQLWPPEKGQPRGLVEFSYPAALALPSLMSQISSGNPSIAHALASSPDLKQVSAGLLDGHIGQLQAVDLAAFLRASLGAIAAAKARMIEAEINKKKGLGWFIPPPQEPALPGSEQARPSGAPSLRHPPSKPQGPGQY